MVRPVSWRGSRNGLSGRTINMPYADCCISTTGTPTSGRSNAFAEQQRDQRQLRDVVRQLVDHRPKGAIGGHDLDVVETTRAGW